MKEKLKKRKFYKNKEMKKMNVRPDTYTYNTMIEVIGKICHDVSGAQRLFVEMNEKGIDKDTITYSTMIDVVGKIGNDVFFAQVLFAEMEEMNIKKDTYVYSTMIDVVGKIGRDVNGAQRLFAEMDEKFHVHKGRIVSGGRRACRDGRARHLSGVECVSYQCHRCQRQRCLRKSCWPYNNASRRRQGVRPEQVAQPQSDVGCSPAGALASVMGGQGVR